MESTSSVKKEPKGDKEESKKRNERKPSENRKFAQISPESVIIHGESIGVDNLSEEGAKALAEDVSCRLREVLFRCKIYKRNMNSPELTPEIVNLVLEDFNMPGFFGNPEMCPTYHPVEEAGVCVLEDETVNLAALALDDEPIYQYESFVRGVWLLPDPSPESEITLNEVKKEEPEIDEATHSANIVQIENFEEDCKPLVNPSVDTISIENTGLTESDILDQILQVEAEAACSSGM